MPNERSIIPASLRHHVLRNLLAYQVVAALAGLVLALVAVAALVSFFSLQSQRESSEALRAARTSADSEQGEALSPLRQRQALNRILENAIAAHGGHLFVDRLLTVSKTGILTQGDVKMELHYAFKRPNRVRYRLQVDDRGARYGFDGSRAWQQAFQAGHLAAPVAIVKEEASGLILTSELAIPAVLYFADSHYIELVGSAEVEGHDCHALDYTGPLLASQRFFIDKETYILRKRERHARLRGQDPTLVAVIFSEFAPVEGVLFPFRETVLFDGEVQTVFEIDDYVINPGILDQYFEMPSDG